MLPRSMAFCILKIPNRKRAPSEFQRLQTTQLRYLVVAIDGLKKSVYVSQKMKIKTHK